MTDISVATADKVRAAWSEILAAIESGSLIRDAHGKLGISRGMVEAFLRLEPARRAEWDAARERSADAFYDEALDVARTPSKSQVESSDARTRIDTLKWAARTRNPRLYGDRSAVDLNVRTIDLTRIISDANARLAAHRATSVIEGEIVCAALPARIEELL